MNITRAFTAVTVVLGFLAAPAAAASKTIILVVENMTCVSCPYIVNQRLSAVPGVTRIEVSLEEKTATVTYDDTKADVNALTKATAEAGYPSTPKS